MAIWRQFFHARHEAWPSVDRSSQAKVRHRDCQSTIEARTPLRSILGLICRLGVALGGVTPLFRPLPPRFGDSESRRVAPGRVGPIDVAAAWVAPGRVAPGRVAPIDVAAAWVAAIRSAGTLDHRPRIPSPYPEACRWNA